MWETKEWKNSLKIKGGGWKRKKPQKGCQKQNKQKEWERERERESDRKREGQRERKRVSERETERIESSLDQCDSRMRRMRTTKTFFKHWKP